MTMIPPEPKATATAPESMEQRFHRLAAVWLAEASGPNHQSSNGCQGCMGYSRW